MVSVPTGPHPLFPLSDFHIAARVIWVILPSRGRMEGTSQKLQPHCSSWWPLTVSLALSCLHKRGLGHQSSQSLQLGQRIRNKGKTPNFTFGNGGAGTGRGAEPKRSNSLKGQRFFRLQSLGPHPPLKVMNLTKVQGIRETSAQLCSSGIL